MFLTIVPFPIAVGFTELMLLDRTANGRDVFADFVQMPAVEGQRDRDREQQSFDQYQLKRVRLGPDGLRETTKKIL
jgi:hypothetical protein